MGLLEKSLYIFNFKRLPLAFFLTFSIILTAYVVELFILPVNFFTFRTWEAISVEKLESVLPGYFYPNMKISMIEEGDLGHHTKVAVKKQVQWITDRYGYRKKNTTVKRHKIVIVGESNIAGSGLTQQDILSEKLEKSLKISVYPYTGRSIPPINRFLRDKRFNDNPPDIVILGVVERNILKLQDVHLDNKTAQSLWLKDIVKSYLRKYPSLAIMFDRVYKGAMLAYVKASIERAKHLMIESVKVSLMKTFREGSPAPETSAPFFQDIESNRDVSNEEIERAAQVIKSYDQVFKKQNIRFVFLPIPNRENIYVEDSPIRKESRFLEQVIHKLKNESIEVIDTQKAFKEEYHETKAPLYFSDDTHWNAHGVSLASALITRQLLETRKYRSSPA
jgi:alginate O-acetyltransferase complex protein AlgJ